MCIFVEEIRTENLCSPALVIVYQKDLINYNKIFNDVLTNFTYSTKYNGTYRRDGDVCLYIDKQTSCCRRLTLPRQRVW